MSQKEMYQYISITLVQATAAFIGILLSIAMMTKGWGLEVQSWGWVIGGSLVVSFMGWLVAISLKLIYGVKEDDI